MRKIDIWTKMCGSGMGLCLGLMVGIAVNEKRTIYEGQCFIGLAIGFVFWVTVSIFFIRRIWRDTSSEDRVRRSNWFG